MIKIYEAIRQNNARLVTHYCGVAVILNFVDGNIYAGKNAQLRTNDKFRQDAIEHDPRFGVAIRLKSSIAEPSDEAKQPEQPAVKTAGTGAVQNAGKENKGGKGKGKGAKEAEAVESVKTLNDAMDYFAEKGEFLESKDQIGALQEKYNVNFPNLNL